MLRPEMGGGESGEEIMNRVCVFIDGSNLYHALKRCDKSTRVNYYEFSKALVEAVGNDTRLVRTYFYIPQFDEMDQPEKAKGQQPFFDSLYRTPFLEVRAGKVVPLRDGGWTEKGIDVRMATDIVHYGAHKFYDTAVIVTADQDLVPAVEAAKEYGNHIIVAGFFNGHGFSKDLMNISDRTISLDEISEGPCKSLIFLSDGLNGEYGCVNGL